LALLELRANCIPFDELRKFYHYAEIDISGLDQYSVPDSYYRTEWRRNVDASRAIGSRWVAESQSPILRVRSTALPVEWNFVLNTAHPDFAKARFSTPRAIPLDDRL
jgi:RES domain-containing protein